MAFGLIGGQTETKERGFCTRKSHNGIRSTQSKREHSAYLKVAKDRGRKCQLQTYLVLDYPHRVTAPLHLLEAQNCAAQV